MNKFQFIQVNDRTSNTSIHKEVINNFFHQNLNFSVLDGVLDGVMDYLLSKLSHYFPSN